jgi:hypothetical protein
MTIERPSATAARAAFSMMRSAVADPARSTGITPCFFAIAPQKGIEVSSRFTTTAGSPSSTSTSSVSYIDWCLAANSTGPAGISPSTLLRTPRRMRAHRRWKSAQRRAWRRSARGLIRAIAKALSTAPAVPR